MVAPNVHVMVLPAAPDVVRIGYCSNGNTQRESEVLAGSGDPWTIKFHRDVATSDQAEKLRNAVHLQLSHLKDKRISSSGQNQTVWHCTVSVAQQAILKTALALGY